MAKQIESLSISFNGAAGNNDPEAAIITYCVSDTVETDLKKRSQIEVTDNPQNVTWASAKTLINTAEGIS